MTIILLSTILALFLGLLALSLVARQIVGE